MERLKRAPRLRDLNGRQLRLVRRAVAHGVPEYVALCAIVAAERWRRVSFALMLAVLEQETGFRHVFGHDPTIFVGAGTVTRGRYLRYRAARRASGNRSMQGVGLGQLTWWETQDHADARGGCHKRYVNADVVAETLSARIRESGYVRGIARYNGSGPNADAYSRSVRARAAAWRRRLR